MILTQCPVCAVALPALTAKQCSRCKTRYCGADCQKQHWEEGGHDKLCRKIRKGGGAEQYHANTKYAEAVVVAAKACAEDTKGQTCYICTQALHWKTKEGLVRGCACRGTAGFAHVSCLAEQAKILVAEAEENHKDPQWHRWDTCSLCEQNYHSIVRCALGWAGWKTYVGRPEMDISRRCAMRLLGNGLFAANQHEAALSVMEADLPMLRRLGVSEGAILTVQGNLASTYAKLGRKEEALLLKRDVYSGFLQLFGEEHKDTLIEACNYGLSLINLDRFEEAKSLWRKSTPVARRLLGDNNEITLRMRWIYARALYGDPGATLDDLREAVTTLAEIERTARRVLGVSHPITTGIERHSRQARDALAAREGDDVSSACEALAAMTPGDA
jgi:hypothetical protein